MFLSDEVRNLAHSTSTASSVFLMLAKRQRSRKTINLKQFKRQLKNNNVSVEESEYMNVFKSLQNLNVGDLIYGRKGNPDLFVWKYDLKNIAKIGIGDTVPALKEVEKENHRAVKSRRIQVQPLIDKALEPKDTIKLIRTLDRHIVISVPMEMFKDLF